jgi:hypothetical protein
MRKLIFILLCFALTNFAYAQDDSWENSTIFSQPFNEVWIVTIKTVTESGLVVISADTDSGLITTEPAKLQGGSDIPARINRVAFFKRRTLPFVKARYSLNILVSLEDDNHTKVAIAAFVEGYNREKWIAFESNGTLEQEFISLIDYKLLGR